jgi:uncharacterized protein DUF3592
MIGGGRFWYYFGSVWLFAGLIFVGASVALPFFGHKPEPGEHPPYWIFSVFGVPAAVAGVRFLYAARKADLRDGRLRETGVQQDAIATGVKESGIKVNGETGWIISYRYTFQGRSFEGKSHALFGSGADEVKRGQKLSVLVDPANPADSLLLYS